MTRHDCVVVPGWGAFIANYVPARYSEEEMTMYRPCRTIGFNASVTHNDGLRREGLSYDAAMRFIADSVMTFRQQLSMDCEVSMGRIGYFRRNQGQYIEFVPFKQDNASDRFFGLADMEIKQVDVLEQERAEQEAVVEAPAAIVPRERNLFSRKATRIAASVAVLIGLGIVLSTPVIVNHDQASMGITVTAPNLREAVDTVYRCADVIHFDDMHFRHDIAAKALK